MIFKCHFERFSLKLFGVLILLLCLPPWIHMDIFGILDPDPHENLCGSETLPISLHLSSQVFLSSPEIVLTPDLLLYPLYNLLVICCPWCSGWSCKLFILLKYHFSCKLSLKQIKSLFLVGTPFQFSRVFAESGSV